MTEGKQTSKSALEKVEAYYLGCAKVVLALAIVGAFFVGVLVFGFIRATRHHWPQIDNPEVLVRDCKTLMLDYPHDPQHEQWPQSVKALHPVHLIIASKHSVFIPISFGGIGGKQWGYLVFDDPKEAEEYKGDETKVIPTNNANIFKWE